MSEPYRSTVLLLIVVATFFQTTVQSAPFQPLKASNGSPLCAVGSPSYSISIKDILGIPAGVPDAVKCAYRCTDVGNCEAFNHLVENGGSCQMYQTRSTNCTMNTTNCFYYQVSSRVRMAERDGAGSSLSRMSSTRRQCRSNPLYPFSNTTFRCPADER